MFLANRLRGSGQSKTQLEFLESKISTADLTTYNFTDCAFGLAVPTRRIIVCVSAEGSTSSVSSVSVAGISASLVVHAGGTDSSDPNCAIYVADVPTGSSGTVSVTFGSGKSRACIFLYRLTSAQFSARSTASDTDNSNPVTASITPLSGGVVVALCAATFGSGAVSWSGLTEDAEETPEGAMLASSASLSSAPGTSVSVSATFTNPGTRTKLVAASWR